MKTAPDMAENTEIKVVQGRVADRLPLDRELKAGPHLRGHERDRLVADRLPLDRELKDRRQVRPRLGGHVADRLPLDRELKED